MWDKLKKEYDEWVGSQAPQSILISMPDGKKFEGLSWRTTPFEVAKSIRYFHLISLSLTRFFDFLNIRSFSEGINVKFVET